ncbi:MAG TPA: hypothetical protein GXX25_14060 [Desulfotomaculum sp.]|nr:hypothetical protein [Desulfotomaculum sp.]
MLVNIVTGYLGSGKTSFIQHLVRELTPRERVVVLVGEFGEVGIDGALLAQDTPDVLELGSECIYCTLSADLARQIPLVARSLAPDRLIIEYPGTAAVQGLLAAIRILGRPLTNYRINITHLIDARAFDDLYNQYPYFLCSQISRADVLVLNKCDLLPREKVLDITGRLQAVNPGAPCLCASYGRVDQAELQVVIEKSRLAAKKPFKGIGPQNAGDIPSYYSFSRKFHGLFSQKKLLRLTEDFSGPDMGQVARAKGIFYCKEGWVRLDYLPSGAVLSPVNGRFCESKVLVIGSDLAVGRISAALLDCLHVDEPRSIGGAGKRSSSRFHGGDRRMVFGYRVCDDMPDVDWNATSKRV